MLGGTFVLGGGMGERRFQGDWGDAWIITDEIVGRSQFTVYRGFRAADREEVAIKVIPRGDPTQSDKLLRREKEIAEKLRGASAHHMIRVRDVLDEDASVHLVMDFAPLSLSRHLGQGDILPEEEALEILHEISVGLQELHQASVIHRDVKPDNILRHDGAWKHADFGLARDAEAGTQSETFKRWGTDRYIAPETLQGESPTFKTDLYSLGCVGYELLAGHPPFQGPDWDDFVRQHLQEAPEPLGRGPAAVQRVVLRMLAKAPGDRPQDARTVAETIDRAKSGEARDARLAALALKHDQRLAVENAELATAQADRARIDDAKRSGTQDLEDLVDEAIELVKLQLPEVTGGWLGSVIEIRADYGELTIHMTEVNGLNPIEPDPRNAIGFGELFLGGRAGITERLAGNVVLEEVDGRFAWMLYRFLPKGGLVQYPYGEFGILHGLRRNDFERERGAMFFGGVHIFTTEIVEITPQLLVDLFAESMEEPKAV